MQSSYKAPSSFRDPSGFVFIHKGSVFRQVNKGFAHHYDMCVSTGLYKTLQESGVLVVHKEVVKVPSPCRQERYKILKPSLLPFISYPYEWSFSQLKSAATMTLKAAVTALEHGMMIKDASAYNVQFVGCSPILIDSLSFEEYQEGVPWIAYRQFCEHFLAPLALASYKGPDLLKMQRVYLDGIPLTLAASLLPARARMNFGLLTHLYLHGAQQMRHSDTSAKKKARKLKVRKTSLRALLENLLSTVVSLNVKSRKTQWSNYYQSTNYSDVSMGRKEKIVSKFLKKVSPKSVWDLGANTGRFSTLAAKSGAYTVAIDIDERAVDTLYRTQDKKDVRSRVHPLVMDLSNPSPSLGFGQEERMGLSERAGVDCVLALAIVHHLRIGHNIPLNRLSKLLASYGEHLIVEFVPKDDSQVERLLRSREDIFTHYTRKGFEKAFARDFTILSVSRIAGTKRTLYLFKRRA